MDARRAVEDVQAAGVKALGVCVGNFGPETPETLIAEWFSGPIMYEMCRRDRVQRGLLNVMRAYLERPACYELCCAGHVHLLLSLIHI